MIGSAQEAGEIAPGNAAEICGVLVDLLEGANNRMRLGLSKSLSEAECLMLFESRWTIFKAAMNSIPSDKP